MQSKYSKANRTQMVYHFIDSIIIKNGNEKHYKKEVIKKVAGEKTMGNSTEKERILKLSNVHNAGGGNQIKNCELTLSVYKTDKNSDK